MTSPRSFIVVCVVVASATLPGLAGAAMPVAKLETMELGVSVGFSVAGESYSFSTPIGAPVPTYVSNTPRDVAQWLAARGIGPAGLVAGALPEGAAYDSEESVSPTYSIGGYIPLLPDDSLTISTSPTSTNTLAMGIGISGPALDAAGLAREVPDLSAAGVTDAESGLEASSAGSSFAETDRFTFNPSSGAKSDALPYAPVTRGSGVEPAVAEPSGAVAASTAAAGAGTDAGILASAKMVAAAAAVLTPLALVGWALYHRIRGHSTLHNGTRKAIFDAVCDRPGVGVQEIAKAASVSYSTAGYHLDRLVKERMIVVSTEANKLRYYKNGGSFSEEDRRVLPLLKNQEAMRVLTAILDSPGTYRAALADSLGVTPTTINWHLKRLGELDLILEVRQGRNAYLSVDRSRLQALVQPLMGKLEEHEPDTAHFAQDVLGVAPASAAQSHAAAAVPA